MDPLTIYTAWLTTFSICFTFIPLLMVADWRKRGSADGFSSVGLVLPVLMMACWCRHGVMTSDKVNIFINSFNVLAFSLYIAAFAYYQPKRHYLYGQLTLLGVTLAAIFHYVGTHPLEHQPDLMGSIAAGTQIVSLAGGIYDIKRAIGLQTTEYISAPLQFGIFAITSQWAIFGLWVGNHYITVANIAGLAVNLATLALYPVYPPRTWRVPLFGVGGTGKEDKKREDKKKR